MRPLLLSATLMMFAASTAFAGPCDDKAAEKKLAGAAKSSFMKKCEADAKGDSKASSPAVVCEGMAVEKKLAGAAKANFVKKCEADAKK